MKAFVGYLFCGLSITLFAQNAMRTFTSDDGDFRFNYSSLLVHCIPEHRAGGSPSWWTPADACMSQPGLCEDASSSATTIACFAYPKGPFKDKPTFSAAAFFVAEVQTATTPEACLEGSRNWQVDDAQDAKINSIRTRLFHIFEAWTSAGQRGEIYRVFHEKKCYELGIQEATISSAAFDPAPVKEFTKEDAAEVRARLRQPINSFTFLK